MDLLEVETGTGWIIGGFSAERRLPIGQRRFRTLRARMLSKRSVVRSIEEETDWAPYIHETDLVGPFQLTIAGIDRRAASELSGEQLKALLDYALTVYGGFTMVPPEGLIEEDHDEEPSSTSSD